MGLWRSAYCPPSTSAADKAKTGEGQEEEDKVGTAEKVKQGPIFSIENSKTVAPSMRAVEPVSEEQFGKMWAWIERNVGGELGDSEGRGGGG